MPELTVTVLPSAGAARYSNILLDAGAEKKFVKLFIYEYAVIVKFGLLY